MYLFLWSWLHGKNLLSLDNSWWRPGAWQQPLGVLGKQFPFQKSLLSLQSHTTPSLQLCERQLGKSMQPNWYHTSALQKLQAKTGLCLQLLNLGAICYTLIHNDTSGYEKSFKTSALASVNPLITKDEKKCYLIASKNYVFFNQNIFLSLYTKSQHIHYPWHS